MFVDVRLKAEHDIEKAPQMRGFFFIMFDLFFYVMFGFNPGISFTDSRAKHGNDRK